MAIVRYILDPKTPPRLTKESRARFDALTPGEIERNAEHDPDNPPMTDDELSRGRFARAVRQLRQDRGFSQAEFAERFHVGLPRLRDWEQGRSQPDSVAIAYLKVIAHAPKTVERALAVPAKAEA